MILLFQLAILSSSGLGDAPRPGTNIAFCTGACNEMWGSIHDGVSELVLAGCNAKKSGVPKIV